MDKKFFAFCLLFLLLGAVVLKVSSVYGVGWDFVAHYVSSKAVFANGFFNTVKTVKLANGTSANFGIIETRNTYFEFYRAPLSILVFAFMNPVFGLSSILAYLVLMVMLLLCAVSYFSKSFNLDYLLVGSLVVLPYLVIFPFMVNSEEMLSLSLVIIALALLKKGKWQLKYY